jgi:hypothetical protein
MRLSASSLVTALAATVLSAAAHSQGAIGNSYIGTTPCDAPVREFLDIPAQQACDLVRWDLQMHAGTQKKAPRLNVTAEYGSEGQSFRKIKREGGWTIGTGIRGIPETFAYSLSIGGRQLGLWELSDEAVYLLDRTRRPLTGNGGYSYTLSRAVPDPPRTGEVPEMGYTLRPLATGPDVAGVYEGRTTCVPARVLQIEVPAGCEKLKWRLTLFLDSESRRVGSYRLEGALFPAGAREGKVVLQKGTGFSPSVIVLRLDPPSGGQPLFLVAADTNVLLFVDGEGKVVPGNRDFGNALNRVAL